MALRIAQNTRNVSTASASTCLSIRSLRSLAGSYIGVQSCIILEYLSAYGMM
jgi:hypothetical protein